MTKGSERNERKAQLWSMVIQSTDRWFHNDFFLCVRACFCVLFSRSLAQPDDAGAFLELLLPSYKALPEDCIQKSR